MLQARRWLSSIGRSSIAARVCVPPHPGTTLSSTECGDEGPAAKVWLYTTSSTTLRPCVVRRDAKSHITSYGQRGASPRPDAQAGEDLIFLVPFR